MAQGRRPAGSAGRDRGDALEAIVDALAVCYGTRRRNLDDLADAFVGDVHFWATMAAAQGQDLQRYLTEAKKRAVKRLWSDTLRLYSDDVQYATFQKVERWIAEGEKLRAKYPDFSLAEWIDSKVFKALLRSGRSMEQAYLVARYHDLAADDGQDLAYHADRPQSDDDGQDGGA